MHLHNLKWCKDKLVEHKQYITEYGEDMEDVRNWKWDYLNSDIQD